MNGHCDFLVLGSGIAGLTFAIKIAEHFSDKEVVVITKSFVDESTTRFAQGGIAVVTDQKQDSIEQHIEDTLIAGDGMCRKEVVKMVIEEGGDRLSELVSWGVNFDREKSGGFNLHREGGHRFNRIIHQGDSTGQEVQNTLLNRVKKLTNVTLLPQHAAIDLIHNENACFGAEVLDVLNLKIIEFYADITLMATGGIGQVFRHTTNPNIATGDAIGMALRAGVETENMEFIQFHPTALYNENIESEQIFLISEAVRGFGAILRNHEGVAFMASYDKRKELAPRDIVSRAIVHEMKIQGRHNVFLDCTEVNQEEFKIHFPVIQQKCIEKGIDLSKQYIPVVPAAHYSCGGIKSDENGRSSMNNLLVCGECASTGLHGANRLASNSLLEALVFAHRCFLSATEQHGFSTKKVAIERTEHRISEKKHNENLLNKYRKEIQNMMSKHLGIVCFEAELSGVQERLTEINRACEDWINTHSMTLGVIELRNIILVAQKIVLRSIKRKENKGVFFKV